MSIDRALVDAALAAVIDPNTGRPFAAAKNFKNVSVNDATVSLDVVLGYPAKRQFDAIQKLVADALLQGHLGAFIHAPIEEIDVLHQAHRVRGEAKAQPSRFLSAPHVIAGIA